MPNQPPKAHNLNGFDAYTITASDGITQATFIPQRGATACSIKMPGPQGGREVLYLHDCFWDQSIDDLPGGWPFCFPVCARLERQGRAGVYLYDGRLYQLPIHGFAWQSVWQVEQYKADQLIVSLQYNQNTLQQYPFKFYVRLRYQVSPGKLICEQHYKNLGKQPMPYYAGFHPYFLTPPVQAGKAEVMLNYQPIRHFQYNENFTDLVGEQPLFTTPISVADPQINEQLTEITDNTIIELYYPDNFRLRLTAGSEQHPNFFPYVQLYTMADRPFICVEPWMGYPNAMNSLQGVRWLPALQKQQGLLVLSSDKRSI